MKQLKVLQLCHKPPLPKVDGGCIAIYNISKGLLEKGVDLKILTASTEKHPFHQDQIPNDFLNETDIEAVFLDTRVNIIDAFSALVTADSYNVSRFFSPDFERRLIELMQENTYDVIHLESLFMTPYISTIRKYSSAKIVLRSHNLEHLIWERLANSTGNKAKKMYLKHLASKLKRYEQKTINEVDALAAISDEDKERFEKFKCKRPIVTVPFGLDLKEYECPENFSDKTNKLFHIGAMNWEPNKEGMNWFFDEIWPLIQQEDLEFHMAGRYIPSYFKDSSSDNFIVHGEVEDAKMFIQNHDVMIVPLLSGSGIRIKIIEGMACGKAVVTTSVGSEGLNCEHEKNIIIADTAAEIAEAIKKLMKNPEKIKELGRNARTLIEQHYDSDSIIENLISFYQK